jgi:hypothetical protein
LLNKRVLTMVSRIPTLTYNSHVDDDKGFSINYPPTWEKQSSSTALAFYQARGLPVNLAIFSETLSSMVPASAYFESVKQSMLKNSYSFIGSKEVTINQMTAIRGLFNKGDVTQTLTTLTRGTTGWGIVCTARSGEFIDYAHTFNEIINSFRLTK